MAIVVKFLQRHHDLAESTQFGDRLNKFVPKSGCTVVADGQGVVQWVIRKSLPSSTEADETASDPANLRLTTLLDRLDSLDRNDPGRAYRDPTKAALRLRVPLSRLHAEIDRSL